MWAILVIGIAHIALEDDRAWFSRLSHHRILAALGEQEKGRAKRPIDLFPWYVLLRESNSIVLRHNPIPVLPVKKPKRIAGGLGIEKAAALVQRVEGDAFLACAF